MLHDYDTNHLLELEYKLPEAAETFYWDRDLLKVLKMLGYKNFELIMLYAKLISLSKKEAAERINLIFCTCRFNSKPRA